MVSKVLLRDIGDKVTSEFSKKYIQSIGVDVRQVKDVEHDEYNWVGSDYILIVIVARVLHNVDGDMVKGKLAYSQFIDKDFFIAENAEQIADIIYEYLSEHIQRELDYKQGEFTVCRHNDET